MPRRTVKTEIVKLDALTQDPNNANVGTPYGQAFIEGSFQQNGAGRSVLLDKNLTAIAGNKSLDAGAATGFDEVILVHTNGRQMVGVVRDDLDLSDPNDIRARQLALDDNAASELNLRWNPTVLQSYSAQGVNVDKAISPERMAALLAAQKAQYEETPLFQPVGIDEQGRLDEKAKCTCPECGHIFTP